MLPALFLPVVIERDNAAGLVFLIIIVLKLTTRWIGLRKPTGQPKSYIERKGGQYMTEHSIEAAIQEWSSIEDVGSTAKPTGWRKGPSTTAKIER